jgi:hypothetical protein
MPLNLWSSMLLLSICSITNSFVSPNIRSKYFLKTKFDINGVFSKFNAPSSAIDPDPRRSVLLILLKPGCPHSRKFERRIKELVTNIQSQSFKGRFELKFYECPPDATCATIFNAKSYPEIRFYSVRESPRRFFIRYNITKKFTILKLLKWIHRRRELSSGRNDIFHFDKEDSDDGVRQLDTGEDQKMKNSMSKQLKRMKKMMGKLGYFYGELNQFTDFNFWKKIYKQVVEKKKELLIFCRDSFTKSEYYVFRKILSLYPKMRVMEIRKCSQFRNLENSKKLISKTKAFIRNVFGTKTKSWSEELGLFMKKKFEKIFKNFSGKDSRMYLINFEQFYMTSFRNKHFMKVSKFRKIFKGKRRPNLVYLTSSIMKLIMQHSQPAMFLFLNESTSSSERSSIVRSFRELSKSLRYDKNLLFIPIGGKKLFLAHFLYKIELLI